MAEQNPPNERHAGPIEGGTMSGLYPDPGLTAAEYAAIHLRVTSEHVPDWLNAMVRERQRMDAAMYGGETLSIKGHKQARVILDALTAGATDE